MKGIGMWLLIGGGIVLLLGVAYLLSVAIAIVGLFLLGLCGVNISPNIWAAGGLVFLASLVFGGSSRGKS